MMKDNAHGSGDKELRAMKKHISNLLDECIPHGFFNITIEGKVAKKDSTVDVIITGGPSVKHRVTIPCSSSDKEAVS